MKKRSATLLVPFVAWTAIGVPFLAVALRSRTSDVVFDALRESIVDPIRSVWFLLFTFIAVAMASTIWILSAWMPTGIAACLVVIGVYLVPLNGVLVWSQVRWLFPFVALGLLISPRIFEVEIRAKVVTGAAVLAALAVCLLVIFWQPEFSVYLTPSVAPSSSLAMSLWIWVLRYSIAVMLCAAVLIVFANTGALATNTSLTWLGRNSLGIYCVQAFALPVAARLVAGATEEYSLTFYLVLVPSLALLALLMSSAAVWILKRYGASRMILLGVTREPTSPDSR